MTTTIPLLADDGENAKRIVVEEILPDIEVKSVSWGDSLTFYATQVLGAIKKEFRYTHIGDLRRECFP